MKTNFVLLNGFGFSEFVWKPILPALQKLGDVTLIAREGKTLAQQTARILSQAPKKAIFIGWSLGGLIAQYIAIQHSDRVSGLITLASSPKLSSDIGWSGLSQTQIDALIAGIKNNPSLSLRRFALDLFGQHHRDTAKLFLSRLKKQTPLTQDTLLNDLQLIKTADVRINSQQITCKQLHIHSTDDAIVPFDTQRACQCLQPHAIFATMHNAGHIPFHTNPTQVLKHIKAFTHESD